MSGDIFWLSTLGNSATGHLVREARDAIKHPTGHRTVPSPQQRTIQPQRSTVMELGNLDLKFMILQHLSKVSVPWKPVSGYRFTDI